MVLFK